MRFRTFEIVLDPDLPVYIAGQVLKGYLRVSTSERMDCRCIKVWVKGWAKVKWKQGSGNSSRTYKAKEQYFRNEAVLWRRTDNSFPATSVRFPFNFVLPPDIPSSFKSRYGKVVYKVKAQAYLPFQFNQSTQKFFSVNFLYDLNRDPNALKPLVMEKEKTVCSLCCSQGTISLSLRAQRSGFVPGESVVVDAEVVNGSSFSIEYTEIKLEQLITYIVGRHIKAKQRTVQREYHQQVAGGQNDAWSAVPLPIPSVPPSHLLHCNLITIHYDLTFKAKLDPFLSVQVKTPIVIGSLPLQATYSIFRSPSPVPFSPSSPLSPIPLASLSHIPSSPSPNISPSAPPDLPHQSYDAPPPPYTSLLPEEYKEIPPPSYAACVFGAGEAGGGGGSDESDDEGGFAPQYLIYRTNT